ncbi:DUF2760 domain-containing protein [Desulfatitalea alkaliphila]|uniref:DUF2760 domain-containing protein n=1 Tax=Desulfatitalea alkaliphila TaxID=2929485 RepID=A0AA41R373_9BACT|nr:DUF2760 domain-containing protein [Desulfatitalea alkaliphila]MCJ8501202.1 DUF2760 domain-containing protein [Desulfatitalea alkaliphila]
MNNSVPLFRRLFIRIAFFNLLACGALIGAAYWLLDVAAAQTGRLVQAHPASAEITRLAEWMGKAAEGFWPFIVPAVCLFFLLITLLSAWSARRAMADVVRDAVPPAAKSRKKSKPAPTREPDEAAEAAAQRAADAKRLYLHLVSVLQKEGRLLDFFSEDLTPYNDGQIGAAVRSIHEGCKKALDDVIAPQAILAQQEEEEIEVAADFDPNALKLVGNVTGRPPFKGIVRHRGWRARKLDLPSFSGSVAPEIIAPAEVEVR